MRPTQAEQFLGTGFSRHQSCSDTILITGSIQVAQSSQVSGENRRGRSGLYSPTREKKVKKVINGHSAWGPHPSTLR